MKNKSIQLTVDGAVGFFPKEFVEKAVGLQMPKKPVEGFPRDYKCNECHCTVFTAEHYCGNCGQALDWSDTE